ncbi:ATP-binding protein [Leucobacter sp. USHLN153]|uniref:ATP-binding protein n=1 Tax=Leucobacter sp. USHLN153 TaxID=3081268 RepID=UPI0030186429
MGAEPPLGNTLELRGPADLAFVDRALDALEALWLDAEHVSPIDQTMFALALSEILTNIATHGTGEAGSPADSAESRADSAADGAAAGASPEPRDVEIELRIEADQRALTATIRDTAAPASIVWGEVEMASTEAESGRGLALVRAALDEVEHTATSQGNTWRLRRSIAPEG